MEISFFSSRRNKLLGVYLFSVITALLVSSCSSIQGVRITNATTEQLSVKAFFTTPSDVRTNDNDIRNSDNNIAFTITAGASDFWQYEIRGSKNDTVDKSFVLMTIENDQGCTAEFDRHQIEEKAEKNGMWILVIQRTELDCQNK